MTSRGLKIEAPDTPLRPRPERGTADGDGVRPGCGAGRAEGAEAEVEVAMVMLAKEAQQAPAARPFSSLGWKYSYTAFNGSYSPLTVVSEGLEQRYQAQGREASANAGAPMFYRSRRYSPRIGRFIGRSPWGYIHKEINLYDFVSNRPTRFVEPFSTEREQPVSRVDRLLLEREEQSLRDVAEYARPEARASMERRVIEGYRSGKNFEPSEEWKKDQPRRTAMTRDTLPDLPVFHYCCRNFEAFWETMVDFRTNRKYASPEACAKSLAFDEESPVTSFVYQDVFDEVEQGGITPLTRYLESATGPMLASGVAPPVGAAYELGGGHGEGAALIIAKEGLGEVASAAGRDAAGAGAQARDSARRWLNARGTTRDLAELHYGRDMARQASKAARARTLQAAAGAGRRAAAAAELGLVVYQGLRRAGGMVLYMVAMNECISQECAVNREYKATSLGNGKFCCPEGGTLTEDLKQECTRHLGEAKPAAKP